VSTDIEISEWSATSGEEHDRPEEEVGDEGVDTSRDIGHILRT
jgi:hypothetical protein